MYTLFPDGPLVGSPLPTGGTPVPRELCAYQENLDALKDALQAELQLAHVGARPADLAVVDAAEARVRGGEVRMVREIERLEPELHRVVLPGQVEVLEDREVPLGDSRTDERVAADVAEGAEGLEDVGCRVEPALARRVRQFHRLACDIVWPVEAGPDVRPVDSGRHGNRKAGLQR